MAENGCILRVHQEKKIEYMLKEETLINILKLDMYMDLNVNLMRLKSSQSKSPTLKLSDAKTFNL